MLIDEIFCYVEGLNKRRKKPSPKGLRDRLNYGYVALQKVYKEALS
jgi:hypothetical protein